MYHIKKKKKKKEVDQKAIKMKMKMKKKRKKKRKKRMRSNSKVGKEATRRRRPYLSSAAIPLGVSKCCGPPCDP